MKINKYLSSIESFKDRKIAVVGATSGIGLALLQHLVSKEAKVVLLAKDLDLAKKLQEQYRLLDVIEYDQRSFKKIDSAIKILLEKHPDIDSIALNAGSLKDKTILDNGYQGTVGVNYIGTRYFIDTVSPKLKNKVRFVVQGSITAGCHLKKKVDLKQKMNFFKEYNYSKAYLEAYIYKLYVKNKYPNLEYVITEPGISSTNIIRNLSKPIRFLGKYFLKIFFHSPKKASLTLLTGLSNKAHNGDWIVPRGLFTLSGYPKIKSLPQKRRRLFLFDD